MKKQLYIYCFLALFLVTEGLYAQTEQKTNVSIVTDGSSYITGEPVWCSIRVFDTVSGKPAGAGRILYGALLDDKGTVVVQVRFAIENGMASGYIPLSLNLISGIYLVTAVTGDPTLKAPFTPILVINPNKPPAPVKDATQVTTASVTTGGNVAVRPAKPQYGKREKVSIDIDAESSGSRLSLSIRRADTLENFADSLLSGIHVTTVQGGNAALASGEGQVMRARVYPANGTTPVPNVRVFVSVMGTEARIAEAVSDDNGDLNFLLPLLYADAQLVFVPVHTASTGYRIEFNPEPLDNLAGLILPPLVLPEYLANTIRTRVIEVQAQNSFRPEEKTRLVISNPDTTDFYGKPDKRYMLDDYTRFPNMEEILTEFVTEVRIRKTRETTDLQVLNAPYKRFFEEAALVLIDGVPVTDIRQLLELDPLKLRSIDVVSRKFFMGTHSYPGIVHYKSYQGNLGGFTLPVDAAVYNFEGVQLQEEYVSPDYSQPGDARIPDFRNLLYWTPFVETGAGGKKRVDIYSGDLEGNYKITVNGASVSGKQLTGSAYIAIR